MIKNWARASKLWFPIADMPASGLVVVADETQTIQWLLTKPSKAAIDHAEHERDEPGAFLFDDVDGQQHPRIRKRKVKPAFWSPAVYV
jgi:hypothetical protein